MKLTSCAAMLLASFGFAAGTDCLAQDAIQVGDVAIDPPTLHSLGFSVPIVTGDADYDAAAAIDFRPVGTANWLPGLPLLRVRPELTSEESPPGLYGLPVPIEQFAGSLLNLAPATDYEVRITVTDPDGGDRTQIIAVTTRARPRSNPAVPRFLPVTDQSGLDAAISAAQPGDVIDIQPGTYSGPITIDASGTAENPIVLRGTAQDDVVIDAQGASYGVSIFGSHVYVEHLTIRGSSWGALTYDTDGVVIRHSRFTDVDRGISARSGTNRNYYICDNRLEGQFNWPNISSSTWNEEGIAVSGQGHTICHNTLSGFGDALGLSNNTDIINAAIDFFGNDVQWTGDDGLELDFAHRNVRAFRNRITNTGMGASLQPAWGGPVYIFNNLFLNVAHSPYKLNNDPSGFYIFHNTSVRSFGPGNFAGFGWPQLGYTQSDGDPAYAGNFQMRNNIVIGSTQPARVTTALILEDIDRNGWAPDGTFQFVDSWSDLADLQANSPYEANGRIVDLADFATPVSLPADYTTPWSGNDMQLGATSAAVDAGEALPTVNEGFVGSAPDMGALEFGQSPPDYGARDNLDTLPPAPPTNIRVD